MPNHEKWHSFSWALDQMDRAIEAGFPLEAITLQESLMTDRLQSQALYEELVSQEEVRRTRPPSFGTLIAKLGQAHGHTEVTWAKEHVVDLWGELKRWKDQRNALLHSFVKSVPGTPTTPVEQLTTAANQRAKEGKRLCKAVLKWRDSMTGKTAKDS